MSEEARAREIVDTLIDMIADTRDNGPLYAYMAAALARRAGPTQAEVERARDEILAAQAAINPDGDATYGAGYLQGLLEAVGVFDRLLALFAPPSGRGTP